MNPQVSIKGANSGLQIGINHGQVTQVLNLTQTPEIPRSSLFTVPFRRDPDFIDHDGGLDQLRNKCSMPASRVALIGLGGVGKSQLAIEYCYQIQERTPDTCIFWIHASNIARFEQGCQEIAKKVKAPEHEDPEVDIIELVFDWLNYHQKGNWVLIIDNLDDGHILDEPRSTSQKKTCNEVKQTSMKPLLAYLPVAWNGTIIITTRSRDVASKVAGWNEIITVQPMDEDHATELFQKKVRSGEGRDKIIGLVTALECMPLAIVQAAAYIKQMAPRYSVARYLEEFCESDHKKLVLLQEEKNNHEFRRDWAAKNSIITTWGISFDSIRQTKPGAADLLSLMSFFDRQDIPESLLRIPFELNLSEGNLSQSFGHSGGTQNEEGATKSSVEDDFENNILTLRNYSLISAKTNASFGMHRLVQVATQEWLEMHEETEKWRSVFCIRLAAVFPIACFENWSQCELLFPHARSAELQKPYDTTSIQEWARIMRNAGSYARMKGNYDLAQRMCEQSVESLMGRDDEEIILSLTQLALTFWSQGQWKQAAELEAEVVKTSSRILGAAHPYTLGISTNLASTYCAQGKWQEAEDLLKKVRDLSPLAPEHPHSLHILSHLASVFRKQGRLQEAEALCQQVARISSQAMGDDHPMTLDTLANLAGIYQEQGKYDLAEKLAINVTETSFRVLGAENPISLACLDCLGWIFWHQKRWKESQELFLKLKELQEGQLGSEHPETLATMTGLASVYFKLGDLELAEQMEQHIVAISLRVMGKEHPRTLISLSNLASTYREQGRLGEAKALEIDVMDTWKQKYGLEHPSTLKSMHNLAKTLQRDGSSEQAVQLIQECLRLRIKVLGGDHPDTISSSTSLAKWQETEAFQ